MKRWISLFPILALGFSLHAEDAKDGKDVKPEKKAKPYILKTCLVADETLDADPQMKSYTFVHEGQEVKLCCKGCLKDFKKSTAKYLKKLEKKEKEQEKAKS